MKNFIFISPNFPLTYWRFCKELKNNGLRVLGIGDCPYDELTQEQKDSMHEYYKVSSLENYDEVFRAVAFFSFKYGKIDWLESNNEYWLERDAKLRTEFHITSGFQEEDMIRTRYKSGMKAYYAKAGIPTARYHLVKDRQSALDFAHLVGYPVVVKPDNGVGANATYKLKSDEDMDFFFATKDNSIGFIMEEFVNGEVRTYDAIINSKGEPVFESGNVTCDSLMDVVNEARDSIFYIVKELPEHMKELGRKTVKAFNVKSRFVHFEYFVLKADQEGLGKKGDIFGLEVNMRPPGGYAPELANFANSVDVYKIWADMIAYDSTLVPMNGPHYFCGFVGRRDAKNYKMSHDDIMREFGHKMKLAARTPVALAGAMADMMYVANYDTEEEMYDAFRRMCETW
ncbi:MAG: ATP-grasp domain-containing protein [Oscillospiraceae bacterium]|nr:ATP-grasp domain-containing protein [Oscillospiraceae bacterium]